MVALSAASGRLRGCVQSVEYWLAGEQTELQKHRVAPDAAEILLPAIDGIDRAPLSHAGAGRLAASGLAARR
ncbi:MAG: hypothetical protein CMN28_11325 [Salinisphaeraceae bacterium]|nr:hypothetical protein [Salinisphaeraceae bacterium]